MRPSDALSVSSRLIAAAQAVRVGRMRDALDDIEWARGVVAARVAAESASTLPPPRAGEAAE